MLKKLEEFVGKTIVAAVFEGDSSVWFRFSDGTIGGLQARYHYEDIEIEIADDPDQETLVKLGLLEQAELDRQRAEAARLRQERITRNEREEYERLKKKFESQEKTG